MLWVSTWCTATRTKQEIVCSWAMVLCKMPVCAVIDKMPPPRCVSLLGPPVSIFPVFVEPGTALSCGLGEVDDHGRELVSKLAAKLPLLRTAPKPAPKHLPRTTMRLSCFSFRNHLEERLLDQAQARVSYTPPLFGVVCVAYPNVWFLMSNPL